MPLTGHTGMFSSSKDEGDTVAALGKAVTMIRGRWADAGLQLTVGAHGLRDEGIVFSAVIKETYGRRLKLFLT